MVWRTLRAMPLRLLERVMPWVTASLSSQDTQQMLTNMRLGAPETDSVLVELLTRWAVCGDKETGGQATGQLEQVVGSWGLPLSLSLWRAHPRLPTTCVPHTLSRIGFGCWASLGILGRGVQRDGNVEVLIS